MSAPGNDRHRLLIPEPRLLAVLRHIVVWKQMADFLIARSLDQKSRAAFGSRADERAVRAQGLVGDGFRVERGQVGAWGVIGATENLA